MTEEEKEGIHTFLKSIKIEVKHKLPHSGFELGLLSTFSMDKIFPHPQTTLTYFNNYLLKGKNWSMFMF